VITNALKARETVMEPTTLVIKMTIVFRLLGMDIVKLL